MIFHMKRLIFAAALLPVAFAQTYVSAATGNDTTICTRTAPCRTFQRALLFTTAGGSVFALDPGDYGSMTITQAVTIEGMSLASNIATTGTAITINAPSTASVQLRNLAIRGNGATLGIAFNSGASLSVENVKVSGFNGTGIQIEAPNTLSIAIKDTTIDNCSRGIVIAQYPANPNVTAMIDHVAIHDIAAYGLYVDTGRAVISNSTVAGMGSAFGGTGMIAEGSAAGGAVLTIDNCQVTGWSTGIGTYLGTAQLSRSAIENNLTGLSPSQGAIISSGNNTFSANTTNGAPTSTVSVF
jgi:hypothetical protein